MDDSSIGSLQTLVTYGSVTRSTWTFNEQTNIKQVEEYVLDTFGSSLPKPYRIVYYDADTASFVILRDQLQNGFNPFQLNPSVGVRNSRSITNTVQLYVVNDSSKTSDICFQAELIQDDQIVSIFTEENSLSNEKQAEPNSSVNNEISQESDEYLSINNDDQQLTPIPHTIDTQKLENKLPNRLFFSLDVKSEQRDIYKSDQFSIRKDTSNGRIARVQGVKTREQKMLQVLPKIRIPPAFHNASNVRILVAVVSEVKDGGIRIWLKHRDKGFLPEGYTKDTKAINPISFNINTSVLKTDGDFELSLQMVTKWNKSQGQPEEFYRFDYGKSLSSDEPVDESKSSTRLFCVIEQDEEIDWSTFCLSDFIRTPKSSKQRSASATAGRTCSPKRKRPKTSTTNNNADQTLD